MEEKPTTRMLIRTIIITFAAASMFMAVSSVRNNAGIIVQGIVQNTGADFEFVSFVMAVGQIFIGLTPPIFGILADKKGARFTLLTGIVFTVVALVLAQFCKTPMSILFDFGVLMHGALGAISFGLLTSTLARRIPARHQTVAIGFINASGGLGCSLTAPILASAISAGGLAAGMRISSTIFICLIPIVFFLCSSRGNPTEAASSADAALDKLPLQEILRTALSQKNFWLLSLVYFTCGFHMTIITNHSVSQIMSYGFDYLEASKAYSFYGASAICGAVLSGFLCRRFSLRGLLASLCGVRILIFLGSLIMPKSFAMVCAYIFLLGFTGVAAVSPLSALLQKMFGIRGLSMFYPLCYMCHQVGGFLAAWLGGVCFGTFGSYTWLWVVDCVFALSGCLMSMRIKTE